MGPLHCACQPNPSKLQCNVYQSIILRSLTLSPKLCRSLLCVGDALTVDKHPCPVLGAAGSKLACDILGSAPAIGPAMEGKGHQGKEQSAGKGKGKKGKEVRFAKASGKSQANEGTTKGAGGRKEQRKWYDDSRRPLSQF